MSRAGRYRPDPHDVLNEYAEYLRDMGVTERWGTGSFAWSGDWEPETVESEVMEPVTSIEPGPDTALSETIQHKETEIITEGITEETLPDFKTLEEIREFIGDCKRCKLCKGRTNLVFGVGNPDARLVFVGEGPGRDEDEQGEPFVGRAGKLLTDIIEKGMQLKRSDVYIANVVKCRPPKNRNPEPDEIAECEIFLKAQLRVIKPKLICTLGLFATQTLLKTKEGISKLRGNVYEYEGIKLIPTFHPAYLLRDPSKKKLCWEDIQKLMALYEDPSL